VDDRDTSSEELLAPEALAADGDEVTDADAANVTVLAGLEDC
jgi:hypothetical protein